jgi:opacity protein-like surface antigen
MRKVIFAAAAASAMALVAMPAAAQGWYAEANLGPNLDAKVKLSGTVDDGSGPQSGSADLKLKKGWLLSGVVGRNLGAGVSIEGEGLVSRNKVRAIDLGDGTSAFGGYRVTTAGVLANVVYTVPTGMGVAPYVGAGIGWGDSSLDKDAQYDDVTGTIWQVKAGAKVALSPKASVNVGVRYVEGVKFKIQGEQDGVSVDLKAKPQQTAVTVGIHYDF